MIRKIKTEEYSGMCYQVNFKKTRRKLSVWGIIFALISVFLFSISAPTLKAENVGAPSYSVHDSINSPVPVTENITPSQGFGRAGIAGIIILIAAAIAIIAIIVFSVR